MNHTDNITTLRFKQGLKGPLLHFLMTFHRLSVNNQKLNSGNSYHQEVNILEQRNTIIFMN